MERESGKNVRSSAEKMIFLFESVPQNEKDNIISYVSGIADATARMKQREKNER